LDIPVPPRLRSILAAAAGKDKILARSLEAVDQQMAGLLGVAVTGRDR
jgi:hypothetical protein